MSCEYKNYMKNLLDGNLSENKIKEIYEHAKECTECSIVLKSIDQIDKLMINESVKYPYKSNKDKIMLTAPTKNNKYSILSKIYKLRSGVYLVPISLVLVASIYFYKPILNNLRSFNNTNNSATSVQTNIKITNKTESEYIKMSNLTNAKRDIPRLYPSYVPVGLTLCCRTVIGDELYLQFYNFKDNDSDRKTIGIGISLADPTFWEPRAEGKIIQSKLDKGEGLLNFTKTTSVTTTPFEFAELYYQLNNTTYVTITTDNIPKDEIIKIANSIKETNNRLRNDTNDDTILDRIGPMLTPNNKVTINQAIEIVNKLKLQYKVENISQDNYGKNLVGFSVDNGVVTLR